MIIRTILLLVIAAATASALSEENINQQLDGAPGGRIIVDVDFGTIDVSAGADDKVVVEAHRKIDSNNEAQEKEYLAAAPVTVSKDGNTVTIRARRQQKDRNLNWSGRCNMDARYTVRVPRNFNSELRTGGGTIIGSELTGTMSADTSGGKLKFTHLAVRPARQPAAEASSSTAAKARSRSIRAVAGLNRSMGAVRSKRTHRVDRSWCGISAATRRWRPAGAGSPSKTSMEK